LLFQYLLFASSFSGAAEEATTEGMLNNTLLSYKCLFYVVVFNFALVVFFYFSFSLQFHIEQQ